MTAPKKKTRSRRRKTQRAPKLAQIEKTKKALMDATVALLSEIGYRSLTIDRITERAGVARSTLYRHWDSIPDLALDAFDAAIGPYQQIESTTNVKADLQVLYQGVAHSLGRSIWGRALPALIEASHNDPKFHGLVNRMHRLRRQAARDMLSRAKASGQLKPDARIDWILDSISGPLYFRLLISGTPITEPGFLQSLIDNALAPNLANA